ncbi:hypothetical protein STPH1_7763 [Streptomyces sp. OM5714]|nr:hypothetical protein STPH1_7763 [Streptomyces sp. OM5714]
MAVLTLEALDGGLAVERGGHDVALLGDGRRRTVPQLPSQIAASTIESPTIFSTTAHCHRRAGGGEGKPSSTSSVAIRPASGAYDAAGGLHGGVLGLCRDAHPVCGLWTFLAEERQQGPGRQGARAEELRGQGGRHGRMRTSWRVKHSAASNSARSRESA